MKNLFILSLAILLCSCQTASEEPPAADTNTASEATSTPATTQALLLTQDFPYDNTDKDKMTGDYVAQSSIVVPTDLATQSKWIMFEGPVLENDRIAYRYYADSRHRFDIYGKTTTKLVMDTVSWDYHNIMNWGSDILKVGNSLGMGSPAIWYRDSLYTLSDCAEKTITVVDTGSPESAMIRTSFSGLRVGEEQFDLIQDWSIKSGEAWSTIELKIVDGSLPAGMLFATGIVKHLPEITVATHNNHDLAWNWGVQSFHKEQMGMAILSEQANGMEAVADELSHAYVFRNASQAVSYRFLAAWERDVNGIKDATAFEQLVQQATTK